MRRIVFSAHRQAEVIDIPEKTEPLGPHGVSGRTLVTLTSPGTEIQGGYVGATKFPVRPGYAAVFEVQRTGDEVKDLPAGTIVFGSGGHEDQQWTQAADVVPLPAGLAPETAVFARLMGVSMSTLNTTTVHAPARVLVTGLGPVGNLAAQIFATCGYQVTGVDPAESRRASAAASGLADVRPAISDDLVDAISLHVECSGHEKAVLDGIRCVKKGGEVVLVGVPWSRRTEIYSFEFLHAIFHRYVHLRSGWEWEVPRSPRDFAQNSIAQNFHAALRWLAEGRVKVDHLAGLYAPEQAQEVYSGLLEQTLATPAALFDWRTT